MNINMIDLKVLKYIKRKKYVLNDDLVKAFGTKYRPAIENLYENDLVECPLDSYSEPYITTAALPTKDHWSISDNGLYYLANFKEERRLTLIQQIIHYLLGFVSGLATGLLLEWLIKLLCL